MATSRIDAGTVIKLDELPRLAPLLAKAARSALPTPGQNPGDPAADLPSTGVTVAGLRIDPDHVADYAEVCGFRLSDQVPLTYPHVLGFPLAVLLMTRPDFPFGLLGMVHIANHITSLRPIDRDERVDVTAAMANLRPHPKGHQLDSVVTVTLDGDVVWRSVSTYLARGPIVEASVPDDTNGAANLDVTELPLTALWRVPTDAGRRYARVSGDHNPIHLSGLTAKPFGFRRAIAHGMWTTARCLAALEGEIGGACQVDVAFKLPLLLGSTVEYVTRRQDGRWTFGVRSRDGRPHLAGTVARAG